MIQNLLEWKNLIIEVWLMNINIDYGKRVPIYEQIVEEIERMVTLGILLPNTQMPSIRDLACALSINPNTVKKAYDILDSKGIITSKRKQSPKLIWWGWRKNKRNRKLWFKKSRNFKKASKVTLKIPQNFSYL